MRVAATVLAFLALAAPAAWGKTGGRAIIIDALRPNDTDFMCIDPPPPGISDADIWVDSNGDGLPGPDIVVPTGTNFAVDIWIDSRSYAWTNFFVGLGLVPEFAFFNDYLTALNVTYHVTGGQAFPLDDFTLPWAVGMGGFLYPDHSGTQRLLTFSAQSRQLTTPPGSSFCMTPIVSTSAPQEFFSSVGRPESFSLFCAGTVDSVCYPIVSTDTITCTDVPPPGISDADIWVDSNGDGLPGPDIVLPAGTNFAVDVWIDSHSYAWTNFFVALGLVPESADLHQYFTALNVTYHVAGGEGFPLDDFTLPWAVGMGGFLYPDHSGTQRLLTFSAQSRQVATPPGSRFCMTPIVDLATAEKFYCHVGTQTSFSLFCDGTVDSVCYTILPPTARESTSWGRIKGLFQ